MADVVAGGLEPVIERETINSDDHERDRDNLVRKRKKSKSEVNFDSTEEKKKHKPFDNRWIQQRMPACRPIWHPFHVIIMFGVTGIIFLILGGVFLGTSVNTREVKIDYTNCASSENESLSCDQYIRNQMEVAGVPFPTCTCSVPVTIPEELRAPVHVYYGLTNYYQNHRRFVQSWSVTQINAKNSDNLRDTSSCDPLRTSASRNSNASGNVVVVPCGLRMNSAFNDSFTLDNFVIDDSNIAWPTDRNVRFSRLNVTMGDLNGTTPPPNWPQDISQVPNGLQNEHNIVWFRASVLPWIRKLYGRIHSNVPPGRHTLNIEYNYRVSMFSGRKEFILSEVSWLGGRNHFLGAAYMVVGALALVGAIIIVIVHYTCSKWKVNSAQYSNFIGREQ